MLYCVCCVCCVERACVLKHRVAYRVTSRLQARTALAETPGSRFIQESEAALAEQRFGDLLNLLVPHFDVLFEKTNGSGMFAVCLQCLCYVYLASAYCMPSHLLLLCRP